MDRVKFNQVRKLRMHEAILAIAALAFYALWFAGVAFAEGLPRSPRAVAAIAPLSPLRPEDRHGAYLEDLTDHHSAAPTISYVPPYNAMIFEKSIADEMNEKYKAFNEAYIARSPYQLNERGEFLRYQESNKELAEWTLKKLLQWHLDHTIKDNLEKQAKETARSSKSANSDRAAAQTVVAISAVSKAIRGTTFSFGERTKARFKYDLAGGKLMMGLTSPLADAAIDYSSRTGTRQLGAASDPEKMSLRLSRQIEEIGASTGVQYGLLSRTLNYGVNKSLVGPFSAAVNQAHHISDTSKDETVFRLDLGAKF